ncbi:glycerate kinase [Vreelandella rituensis]|uniref:Glycerate kinase n=1 Tax=Vreelandella rituensis TaxID=2282306 RepID=A0A368U6Y1_9GAMM|nr:glycerate kinase [Halomonas rituensis]RCV92745.1 glycerate kinase [Halomonas rituensis]
MNILLCPDSYKDALSAQAATAAMARGVLRADPDATVVSCPLADGGEGSLEALIAATSAQRRSTTVQDALGRPIEAAWGWLAEQHTAYIELAEANGLQHLAPQERNAGHTSSFGTGELIRAALDQGAKRLLLLLGGSATNDAGAGMLSALGARLLDAQGQPLPAGGKALAHLASLDITQLDPRLLQLSIEAAVDVDNPLLGERGASVVFGPQKGATAQDVVILDQSLGHFAAISAETLGEDYRELAGAGAAGGMGFAAHAFLRAKLRPGIEMIMAQTHFTEHLSRADLVITGEGRLDGQSLSGKTPIGVARLARKHAKPVVVLAGSLGDNWHACLKEGVTAAFALADGPMSLEQALRHTPELLADRCENVIRLWQASSALRP